MINVRTQAIQLTANTLSAIPTYDERIAEVWQDNESYVLNIEHHYTITKRSV